MKQNVQGALSPTQVMGENGSFYLNVIEGLTREFKTLPSKYFYDKQGDQLFQRIMACEDYYLIRCEAAIITATCADLRGNPKW